MDYVKNSNMLCNENELIWPCGRGALSRSIRRKDIPVPRVLRLPTRGHFVYTGTPDARSTLAFCFMRVLHPARRL